MRRMSMWGVAVAMVVLLSGCGKPTHESLAKDLVSQMKKLASVLKGVKDEASVKSASPKLEAIAKEMQKIRKQADELGRPTKEQDAALQTKYGEEIAKVAMEMAQEMKRIQMNPKLAGACRQALAELEKIK